MSVCGRKDANVDPDGLASADSLEFALLDPARNSDGCRAGQVARLLRSRHPPQSPAHSPGFLGETACPVPMFTALGQLLWRINSQVKRSVPTHRTTGQPFSTSRSILPP